MIENNEKSAEQKQASPVAGMPWYYQEWLNDGRESYELGENLRKSGLLELTRSQVVSPKLGADVRMVEQNLDDYKRKAGTNAAFREWQFKLRPGERLPRGKFFKGKTAGRRPHVVMDEFWSALSRT